MNTLRSALLVALPLAASAAFACTTQTIIEEKAPEGSSGGPAANEPSPLEGLAADWQAKAAANLDERAGTWLSSPPKVANVSCAMSCHTTFPYLIARSSLGDAATKSADTARARFVTRVSEATSGTAIPFYGKNEDSKVKESHATEAVLNAAALSLDDLGGGNPLSADAKKALDRMWAQQSADGSWAWLEFGLEPWEARNDWGAALAALVAGSIPENSSAGQAAGTAKVISYLNGRLSSMAFHDKVMVLWASGKLQGLLDQAKADEIVDALSAKQLDDGGFSLGSFGKGDIASKGAKQSDGYATALAVLALCRGSAENAKRPDVKKGLAWIAQNQAADGSWPGRSVNSTSQRAAGFMTDAATSYATLAITQCGMAK
ncbi:MAG: terpene cyclase/mutase family protein [Labilithrix sp.]|nr:terpene cyclase/mutase family protein [Labilithrix sp.]